MWWSTSVWFSNLGKHGKRMDQAEFSIFSCTQPLVTGELLTCLVTSEPGINLSLWYHPVFMTAPPIQPDCLQESQRAITEREGVILERKKAKVGKAPRPAAVHSQVLRQGVRLILPSRSRQTSPAVVAGMAKLVLHHSELRGCLLSLSSTPSCKSCSQLCHMPAGSHSSSSWHPTRSSSWKNPALPAVLSPASLAESSSSACLLHLNPGQEKDSRSYCWFATGELVSPSCDWLLSWG